jgi:hypothetical protein
MHWEPLGATSGCLEVMPGPAPGGVLGQVLRRSHWGCSNSGNGEVVLRASMALMLGSRWEKTLEKTRLDC